MTQYLITTFTDSTGLPHNHVTKAKDNQTFTVVEAERHINSLEVLFIMRSIFVLILLLFGAYTIFLYKSKYQNDEVDKKD